MTSAPAPVTTPAPTEATSHLLDHYRAVRRQTMALAAPLSPEDCTVQSMVDASPTKWHLGHTTWFFETLVLRAQVAGYEWYDPAFQLVFNSYYNSIGAQHPRPRRGLLSRPGLAEVQAYRAHVDEQMIRYLEGTDPSDEVREVLLVGMNHEQQHQELLVTDMMHMLSCNPLRPAYLPGAPERTPVAAPDLMWRHFDGGVAEIGYEGEAFAFDNERPRHRVYLEPYALASRPVTNAEYLGFIRDGGYRRPEFWMSDGWATVTAEGWERPLYWEQRDDAWWEFTLYGMQPLAPQEAVSHISYYEADAYARWAGARLPTEAELEGATASCPIEGEFLESGRLQATVAVDDGADLLQVFGNVWEWTRSGYEAYPGYVPPEGPLGEYNSKFMCSQIVLRGGSVATPRSHLRPTYRNFFPPYARWQFAGVRLARDVASPR